MVTGVNGFVGKHLTRELTSLDFRVIGVGQQAAASPEIIEFLDAYHSADLTDLSQVSSLPFERIDAVISLAGLANVGKSYKQPDEYRRVNVGTVTNIAQEMLSRNMHKNRHIAVSTSVVYDPRQQLPSTEDSRLIDDSSKDASPYALSKLAMEKAVEGYRDKGLDIIIARPFNHIGPGQEPGFILPDLFAQARSAILENKPVMVGNLETRRDYTDVRDVARAYGMLVLAAALKHRVYNISSGKTVSGQEILKMLLEQLAPDHQPDVMVDPSKFRPSDMPELYGNAERLRSETGWLPKIAIGQTIADFVAAAHKTEWPVSTPARN